MITVWGTPREMIVDDVLWVTMVIPGTTNLVVYVTAVVTVKHVTLTVFVIIVLRSTEEITVNYVPMVTM